MPTNIIDIHPHIISSDPNRDPLAPRGGKQSGWSRDRPVTFEQYIAAMDEAGVAKAAIVHASTSYGFDNSYVADSVASRPERFTGVFSVDVLAPDAAERIRYWVGKNLSGLRPFTTGSTLPGLVAQARAALATLPQQDQEWILCRTAQALYPALADK